MASKSDPVRKMISEGGEEEEEATGQGPGAESVFRKPEGVSEWRLGVRPPPEGLQSPRGQRDSAGWLSRTQTGDMPALSQTRPCGGHQGGTGGSRYLAWGYVRVSAVQKGRW